MKKIYIWVVSCLCLGFFLIIPSSLSHAEGITELETEVGIELEKSEEKEEPKKPPLIDDGKDKKIYDVLPKTGELISTLIIILLGISLLIFSLGVLSMKQLYQIPSWEV